MIPSLGGGDDTVPSLGGRDMLIVEGCVVLIPGGGEG